MVHKPFVSHFKIFGYVCYAKVPDEKRTKLDSKSIVAVLIGYSEMSKGYRLYSIKSRKVFISRDVNCDKRYFWNWEAEAIDNVDNVICPIAYQLNEYGDSSEHIEDENLATRGTRSLRDIYNRCNVAIIELSNFNEAIANEY